jgi:hypothetical protein
MGLQRSQTDRSADVVPGADPPKLKFTRGADGKLQIDEPPRETKTATEAAERPPQPDDPRSGPLRDVPPVGGF